MSELPDGLPNTCLDCDETETVITTVRQYKDEQLLLTLELNGNKASMIVSYHQAAAPFFELLREQLNESRDQHAA